ncbi:ABC transporter permease [Mucilaginibacter sp.]|uniref:ABC transporter permease n=1 Tax=Mucilaginibacter sp. TaxID=1882438 RepID=UPI003D0B68DC
MIKNYLKIAFRNLWRHKSFSMINIIGLAVGMAACFLIFMYVKFELSYDKFNSNFDNIYRLNTDLKTPNEVLHWSSASAPMGPALQADYPEVKANARVFGASFLVESKNEKFQENNVSFTDPDIFKIFSFPFIQGDPITALKDPFSVVLTETTAKKYFANESALGKTLMLDAKHPVKVTGVIKDVPLNSHFSFDMLISASTMEPLKLINMNEWGNFTNNTYLLLADGFDAKKLQAKLPSFLRKHISDDQRKKGYNYDLFVEPLKAVYMDNDRGAPVNGSMSNVYIFSIVAIFILLIACINFVNLTTARATERAKEVGIRKVVGAGKEQLTAQFLGESVIISLISFLFSVLLSILLLPLFNQLAGKIISHNIIEHGYIFILFSIAVAIGFIAGIYPALVLTSFKITTVLKGRFNASVKGIFLRKGLVVVQFTISIVLIVGTLIVYNQLSFMRNQSLGFKKDQMMVIDFSGDSAVQVMHQSIKNELKSIDGVIAVSGSSTTPGNGNSVAYTEVQSRSGSFMPMNMNIYDVDFDFIPQYGMKIVAGRAFSNAFATDSTQAIVINETTVKSLGYAKPDDAIGKSFAQWGRKGKIIGVVQDFHFESLKQNVKPLNLRINPRYINVFTVTVKGGNIPATIAAVQNKWKTMVPQRPFAYTFLDQNFNKQYLTEDRFGKLFMYFAILAIMISCLGLLGLAAYSTLQRRREIGIRKVLGASIPGIVNMLSKEFLQLVLIAAVIAFPLSWLGMHSWLKDFAYRINIGWWVFAVAGILAVMIAVTTVAFQAIRAALANPVKSLRSE